MNDDRQSRQIKGSGRTYFLDIEETKGGKLYLRITESRKGAGDKFERNSINFRPRPPAQQAVRVGVVPAGRPRLPSPAAPLLTSFAEEPPRSDLSPLRGSSPSLSVSAVGVEDADTQLASLALRLGHLPDPLAGPLGRLRRPFGEYPFGEYLRRVSCYAVP
jgi:hypothetical protein